MCPKLLRKWSDMVADLRVWAMIHSLIITSTLGNQYKLFFFSNELSNELLYGPEEKSTMVMDICGSPVTMVLSTINLAWGSDRSTRRPNVGAQQGLPSTQGQLYQICNHMLLWTLLHLGFSFYDKISKMYFDFEHIFSPH